MFPAVFSSLKVRIGLALLLFVGAGSLALVGWMRSSAESEARRVFAALATANAEFIRTQRLPVSDRTSEALGHVLGVEVELWGRAGREGRLRALAMEGARPDAAGVAVEALQTPGRVRVKGGLEAVAVPVSEEADLLMIRPAGTLAEGEGRSMWWVLGAFWVLSLGLGVVLARGVVAPLQQLAERLPRIGEDSESDLPGAERSDEIGQLARAYLRTRAQLAEERAGRARAERLAVLGRMATGLAHEIHNPLAAIRMHAQLLQDTAPEALPGAAAESLPVMLGEGARIEGLVNQWMFLARPEPPRRVGSDLGALVAVQVRVHQAAARHAGVEIELSLPGELPVCVDGRRLSQAVGNVILNAIQAMPAGGRLRIEGASGAQGVEVRFCDNGPGFSAIALERHTELFFSEKEGGMGIGLSVASEIVRAHGGSLGVANAASGGACVTLQIPHP